ncbi:MAG: hypothetical protein AAF682_19545 [Planctomycetota bacterium]
MTLTKRTRVELGLVVACLVALVAIGSANAVSVLEIHAISDTVDALGEGQASIVVEQARMGERQLAIAEDVRELKESRDTKELQRRLAELEARVGALERP